MPEGSGLAFIRIDPVALGVSDSGTDGHGHPYGRRHRHQRRDASWRLSGGS